MRSIGAKLWAGMMALVIIVLLLLWLFQIVFLESFYTSIRVSEVKEEAISIVRLLGEESKARFENEAEAFAYNNNLSFELLDQNGETVYVAGATGYNGKIPMMRNRERVAAIEKVISGKDVTISLSHPRFGNKFMLIGLPIKNAGTLSGALLLNMPLAPVEDTVTILKKQLLWITIMLLIAAMAISYVISRKFSNRILEIKKVSEKMASGDFSDRIESGSKDEIGSLADTINHMGQELSKIEQLRKDLIANVSHELRTPLSIIQGYAETVRDVSGNVPEKREKQLGIIIEESERLSGIVDDILDLSQLQAGYQGVDRKHFLMNQTVEEVTKRYTVLSENTGIRIDIQGMNGEIEVLADEQRIKQVLYNLINNAFTHTKEGGSITISIVDRKELVKVVVSDTGEGIPAEEMEHVWDRYYKVKKTDGRKRAGTGLGLAIVKSILDAHQALYGVESVVGVGTSFWFELKK